MTNLALRYHVCKKNAPHEGVGGSLEELFAEDTKYDEIFNEEAINKELSGTHVAINQVTCWAIDQLLQKSKGDLPKRDEEYFKYTKWFVLADIYKKLMEWKQENFNLGWQMWIKFIESEQFEKAVLEYSRPAFKIGREIIPADEEAQSFLKTKDAVSKFSSKVGIRNFKSIMNKALNRFQEEDE